MNDFEGTSIDKKNLINIWKKVAELLKKMIGDVDIENGTLLDRINSLNIAEGINESAIDGLFDRLEDSGWLTPKLTKNATFPSSEALRYRKKADFVYLQGGINVSIEETGTTVCTLPEGYRPDRNIYDNVMSGSVTAFISIDTNGNVKVISAVFCSDGTQATGEMLLFISVSFPI